MQLSSPNGLRLGLVACVSRLDVLAGRLALDYHRPLKGGKLVEALADAVRKRVKPLKQDRVLHEDFATIRELANSGAFDKVLSELE